MSPESRLDAFGPNEWLVDEIYQQFLADRSSVDPAWWEFFEGYAPPEYSPLASQPAPAPAPAASPAAAPASPAPTVAPAAVTTSPAPAATSPDGDVALLKGPSARVVTNMEQSLGVPTATSVRSVPAKLLIDNRVVINNHLARGRGGKVSFTHIIGFAAVRALVENEAMNYAFAEVDALGCRIDPAAIEVEGGRPAGVELDAALDLVGVRLTEDPFRWIAVQGAASHHGHEGPRGEGDGREFAGAPERQGIAWPRFSVAPGGT